MTEAELEEHIQRQCERLDIFRFHVRDSRRGMMRGLPDDILIGRRRVLWRELKSESGALTPDQRRVGSRLLLAGQDWGVWRPRDLASGIIASQLDRLHMHH